MKVVKFGGSSVASAEQIAKAIKIVQSDAERRIVVVSAPGKRTENDTKVTDMLIQLANKVLENVAFEDDLQAVVARYAEIQAGLGLADRVLQEIAADLQGRIKQRGTNALQFKDTMKAAGEDNNAKVVAAAFNATGCAARYVHPGRAGMLLSGEFGRAKVLPESFEKLSMLAQTEDRVVFPGFFGQTPAGELATFPRGGADITGAILAAAVKAEVYENFTDVDSVYAMDPRQIDHPPPIEEMTYRELRELAYAGFGVFHDEAILPAVHAGIPICIKNANRPEAPGTRVVPERGMEGSQVAGISSADGFSAISISKYMMNREVGFGLHLLRIFEDEGISYEHIPSGIDNMSVILHATELDGKERRVLERISNELEPDDVSVEHGLALLMVVGEGMHYAVGMAAKATTALAQEKVNIEMMNQGASEISMMFAVKAADRKKALQALGRAFFQ